MSVKSYNKKSGVPDDIAKGWNGDDDTYYQRNLQDRVLVHESQLIHKKP
jgi:hypothetical protein